MNALCVVAHPDDEVLGVGGTIARHVDKEETVHICILSDGVRSRYERVDAEVRRQIERRKKRTRNACKILGTDSVSFHRFPDNEFDSVPLLEIVKVVEEEIEEHEPCVVYTHHYGDLNIDHELTCRAVMTATRPLKSSGVRRVLAFEVLSATEWSVPSSGNVFQPQYFVNIDDQLERKIKALAVYDDELREPPHPRTTETVRQNAKVWGAKAGVPAAESFELLREIQR